MAKKTLTKALKKEVSEIAQLKERVAQLEGLLAKQKTCSCSTKPLDVYRRTLYNEMVENHVKLAKENRREIHRCPIEWYSHDDRFSPSIALLRAFERRRMTKSPGKLEALKYPEE